MKSFDELFSIQVFLIVLRETIESAIIVSVLLSFIHQNFSPSKLQSKPQNETAQTEQTDHESTNEQILQDKRNAELSRTLQYQVWTGGLLGLVGCLIVGAGFLWAFYALGQDLWTSTEHYWEGFFSILASIIISVMGMKILRVNKMQQKWKLKLHNAISSSSFLQSANGSSSIKFSDRYFMFVLPLVTTLREGLEAIVFIGGIGLNENTTAEALILSTLAALVVGSIVGYFLYRLGNSLSLQIFLISSCLFLYLVAAGLMSKGVWSFELQDFINKCGGGDVAESGDGPGSYNIMNSVWHVNCCNGEIQDDGPFWMMMTAVFGWTNSATYGSVIGYNLYWLVIIVVFSLLAYEDKHGVLPGPAFLQKIFRRKKYQAIQNQEHIALVAPSDPRDSISSRTPLTSGDSVAGGYSC